ncbi:antibiotic biosynthesis monooxygenase [Halopseudomonas pachastrellae]|nr:antibiotic biosynthesis monooxygenase [Halopseudomonas pachastrellae]
MFIAMNRFKIKPGHEQDFIDIWKNRDSLLAAAGLQELNLLQGPTTEEYTLFASHATWESRSAFED